MDDRPFLISKAIPIEEDTRLAIIGGGGKTSLMFSLANEWSGKTIIVTTTTHLGVEQAAYANHHLVIKDDDFSLELLDVIKKHKIILVTGLITSDNTRWSGLSDNQIDRLFDFADGYEIPILIEADGSRGRPIKAPAEHEPAIPKRVNAVAVVVGLSALDATINANNVHRVGEFSVLTLKRIGEKITEDVIYSLVTHADGGLKNIPDKANKYLVLNQADTNDLASRGLRIATIAKSSFDRILVCTLKPSIIIHHCVTHIAGVVLAAGEAARFGKIKQLLPWKKSSIIETICKTALNAGLDPVIVILGSSSEIIRKSLTSLPVVIVENHEWKLGQASSVNKGVTSIPKRNSSVIFFLADQPQINTDLILKLIDAYQTSMSPIVYPVFMGRRGNPILFDRNTFGELLKLEGDTGGKKVIEKHASKTIDWEDDSILMDIDTPNDYLQIKDRYNG